MFVTLIDVQSGGQLLQQPIDNREGSGPLVCGLLFVGSGWHNVHPGEFIAWKNSTRDKLAITPGFVLFRAISRARG